MTGSTGPTRSSISFAEPDLQIRPYEASDEAAVAKMWHETKRRAYPYLPTEQSYTLEESAGFFRDYIAPRCDIWLAESETRIVGFLALEGSYLDRLYVHPNAQRSGLGEALLAKAKQLSPGRIELHTHQQNVSACAFYEKHGFHVARFGTSGPPESAPDVEYHWRPTAGDDPNPEPSQPS